MWQVLAQRLMKKLQPPQRKPVCLHACCCLDLPQLQEARVHASVAGQQLSVAQSQQVVAVDVTSEPPTHVNLTAHVLRTHVAWKPARAPTPDPCAYVCVSCSLMIGTRAVSTASRLLMRAAQQRGWFNGVQSRLFPHSNLRVCFKAATRACSGLGAGPGSVEDCTAGDRSAADCTTGRVDLGCR